MASRSSRRGFFKDVLRATIEAVQETGALRLPSGSTEPAASREEEQVDSWDDRWGEEERPIPAPPAAQTATAGDLSGLARDLELETRAGDAQRLARPSIRLTHGTPSVRDPPLGASRLGGAPDVPPAFRWPARDGRELAFLGQVRLEEVGELGVESPLPPAGLLLFFYDLPERPDGRSLEHAGSCAVVLVDDVTALDRREQGPCPLAECPVELSAELTLPSAWESDLESLDLDGDQQATWEELREQLAALQGVELAESTTGWPALHRLLGWPDEILADMQVDCELLANGLDPDDGATYVDPRVDRLRGRSAEWRLLLQLSDDDELASAWGEGLSRLHFWIRESDLRARDFTRVRAIVR